MKRPLTFWERIERRLHEQAVEQYNEAQIDEQLLLRAENYTKKHLTFLPRGAILK